MNSIRVRIAHCAAALTRRLSIPRQVYRRTIREYRLPRNRDVVPNRRPFSTHRLVYRHALFARCAAACRRPFYPDARGSARLFHRILITDNHPHMLSKMRAICAKSKNKSCCRSCAAAKRRRFATRPNFTSSYLIRASQRTRVVSRQTLFARCAAATRRPFYTDTIPSARRPPLRSCRNRMRPNMLSTVRARYAKSKELTTM